MLSKIGLKSAKFPSTYRKKSSPLDVSKTGVVQFSSRYSRKVLIGVGMEDMMCRPWKGRLMNVVVRVIPSKKSQLLWWLTSCRVL